MTELEKKSTPAGSPDEKNSDPIYATKEADEADIGRYKPDLNSNVNARLANPLAGLSHEQLRRNAAEFAREKGLEQYTEQLQKGALVAQDPLAFDDLPDLDEKDKAALRREITHKWDQPRRLYAMVVMCSVAAAVQGMDESVINGANLFFADQFGLSTDPAVVTDAATLNKNQWLLGLVNSAPYICCAFLGCWLTEPLNHYLGRRGAIFVSAVLSALTCFWQGVTNSWEHLFVARFVLGLGIGPKSATVPMYAAETAPPVIRGALVMQWQTWTAFGIMLGYIADLVLYHVPVHVNNITGLNWRLMLGSAGLPAVFVALQVFTCPESPRWLMKRNRYVEAFRSFSILRNSELQAARDLYFTHCLLEEEKQIKRGGFRFFEMFTIPRNARATLASTIVMFGQQFCGVNVIAYYSSSVLSEAGLSDIKALLGSFGFGALNFLFAIPAWYTIDTFGRRNLLLVTFPFLAIFLLITGFSFFIPAENQSARVGVVLTGIYLYAIAYSPGMGPVPFTYSAEAFPLYIRELGMSYATAVLWFFNAVLSITFFRLKGAFRPQGAFGWYAGWCIILWIAVFFFLPETKALSLEELDAVFGVPTKKHAAYQARQVPYFIKKYILRQKHVEKEELYQRDENAPRTALPIGGAA